MSLLVARGICKSFRSESGAFFAVKKCSFALPEKGLIAIVGRSGSGKSTLLNLLSGIVKPTRGDIYFAGKKMRERKHPLLGYEGSFVFQHYNLIGGESAKRNVALPLLIRGMSPSKADDLLKKVGLFHLKKMDVSKLSGGEKQRVALCRALATSPSVVFADEPTGALDEGNGRRVMEALKEVASERLVVMVSHNLELVSCYADAVLTIRDGVVEVPQALSRNTKQQPRVQRFKKGHGFMGRFLLRNLRKNAAKDGMCFFSGFLGFTSILLSFGFFVGNGPAVEEELVRNLGYLQASVCKRTEVQVPGSKLTLVKQTRPETEETLELLDELGDVDVADNYEFFFPSSMTFTVGEQNYEPTAFAPLFDISLHEFGSSLLKKGSPPRLDDFTGCIVNEEFLARYGDDLFGETIEVSSRSVVNKGGTSKEIFIQAAFRIDAVVAEFGFMNSPRVYYSYPALASYLETITVGEGAEAISVVELVASAKEDEAVSSYSSLIFVHDVSEMAKLFSLVGRCKQQGFEIQSAPYSLREAFLGLSDAFTRSLVLFVGIALIGLCLILGMTTLSSIVAGKKETAILLVLGASRKQAHSIYRFEACLLCVGSALVSLVLCPLFQQIANHFLHKEFDIESLIAIPYKEYLGIPWFVPIVLIIFSYLVGLLSSAIPLHINRRIDLAEELRDE